MKALRLGMQICLLGGILGLGSNLFAAEPAGIEAAWIKLSSRMRYQIGAEQACHTRFWLSYALFAAEIREKKITRAAFRSWKYPWIVEELSLTPQEIAGVTLEKDALGRYWLKRLTLTPRLLGWLFFYLNESWDSCRPSELATLGPASQAFDFETEGIPYGIFVSYSSAHDFYGNRRDQASYRVEEFALVQMMLAGNELEQIRKREQFSYAH